MPQAGWYNAPSEQGFVRFWNGTAWTEHRQPLPQPVPEVPAIPVVPVEIRPRRALGLPIVGMAACLILAILGIGVIVFMGQQTTAAAGETSTHGTVTALGWKAVKDGSGVTIDDCYPSARFVAAGASHTARSRTGQTPCPVNIGDTATVVYSIASPDDARIALPAGWLSYAWLLPVAAGFGLIASLIAFILRMRVFAPVAPPA
ncbi:MAG TPA: DUF2510 domain-containing protein [Galbitalea sp.]|jgi:hypothetical protein